MSETWWVGEEQLDDQQKDVIELPLDGDFLVTGPPGCGKTNLLLLRGNYLSLAGVPNIAIVVFTRTLQEFIASGGKEYAFPVSKVMTSRRFAQNVLSDNGRAFTPPDDFEGQRAYCIKELKQLIADNHIGHQYDAILLDEAQDYLPEEIELFRQLGRILFAVADSKQKIYGGAESLTAIRAFAVERKLHFHYRCGRNICRLADAIGKRWPDYEPMTPTSHYDEQARPSTVDLAKDANEQADKIVEKLRLQLKAYPGELLGVITPRQEELARIWEKISTSDLAQSAVLQRSGDHARFSTDKTICVGTLHSAKGLEFRALHIAGCEFLKNFYGRQRTMAFTAITRTKTSLSIYYTDDLPGYFEAALQSLQPIPDLPKIRDVFGRKK